MCDSNSDPLLNENNVTTTTQNSSEEENDVQQTNKQEYDKHANDGKLITKPMDMNKLNLQLIQSIKNSRQKRKLELVRKQSLSINSKIKKQNKTRKKREAIESKNKKKRSRENENDSKVTKNQNWTREAEKIMISWKQKTQGYAWMHNQAARFYGVLDTMVSLPILIFSTLLSTNAVSTFTMDAQKIPQWITITIGCITILVTLLSAIQTFFSFSNHRSKHLSASKGFNGLTRKIQNELVKARHNRQECYGFFELISNEYNQLLELDSGIPGFITRRYRVSMEKMLKSVNQDHEEQQLVPFMLSQTPRGNSPIHPDNLKTPRGNFQLVETKQQKRKSVSLPEVNIPLAISDSSSLSCRSSVSEDHTNNTFVGADNNVSSECSGVSVVSLDSTKTQSIGSPPGDGLMYGSLKFESPQNLGDLNVEYSGDRESYMIQIQEPPLHPPKLKSPLKTSFSPKSFEFEFDPIHREDSLGFIDALRSVNNHSNTK